VLEHYQAFTSEGLPADTVPRIMKWPRVPSFPAVGTVRTAAYEVAGEQSNPRTDAEFHFGTKKCLTPACASNYEKDAHPGEQSGDKPALKF
jgi:hypothetical protein